MPGEAWRGMHRLWPGNGRAIRSKVLRSGAGLRADLLHPRGPLSPLARRPRPFGIRSNPDPGAAAAVHKCNGPRGALAKRPISSLAAAGAKSAAPSLVASSSRLWI
eukprot:scaffold620_cov386-Prasinococcus_capsulatus_cf.AAC.10